MPPSTSINEGIKKTLLTREPDEVEEIMLKIEGEFVGTVIGTDPFIFM